MQRNSDRLYLGQPPALGSAAGELEAITENLKKVGAAVAPTIKDLVDAASDEISKLVTTAFNGYAREGEIVLERMYRFVAEELSDPLRKAGAAYVEAEHAAEKMLEEAGESVIDWYGIERNLWDRIRADFGRRYPWEI